MKNIHSLILTFLLCLFVASSCHRNQHPAISQCMTLAKKYARNIYLQHPDRNNLWGISDLLALYDISNVSISMSDKEDIDRLSVPFLAEFSQDLVLVTQCNSDFVEIVWKNSLVKIARQQFLRSWTGVVTPVAQVSDLPFNQRLS